MSQDIRITIKFFGKVSGALGICYDIIERRTVTVPSPFTEEEVKEEARKNLYYPQGDSPPYDHVTVTSIAFN